MSTRRLALFAAFAVISIVLSAQAETAPPYAGGQQRDERPALHSVRAGEPAVEADPRLQAQALMQVMASWISFEFGLPRIDAPPEIAFAPATRMAALRFRDVPSDRGPSVPADILAVYDDEARTIYLPESWSGTTPADLSVLVHEMVHHIQNVAGLSHECPEAREKLAFEAQERWLAIFGSNLMAEFQIDPMTLLVRTHCGF